MSGVLAISVTLTLQMTAEGNIYDLYANTVPEFSMFDNYSDSHPLLLGEYAVVEYDL